MACHFEAILSLLDGYAIWLQNGRQADNLFARIGKATTAPFPQIDPRTRDQYLRLLKQYLFWWVTRYIPRARQDSTTLAIGAVTAELYPRIDLGGFFGFIALRGGDLGDRGSRAFSVMPSVSWPALHLASVKARQREAQARETGSQARFFVMNRGARLIWWT